MNRLRTRRKLRQRAGRRDPPPGHPPAAPTGPSPIETGRPSSGGNGSFRQPVTLWASRIARGLPQPEQDRRRSPRGSFPGLRRRRRSPAQCHRSSRSRFQERARRVLRFMAWSRTPNQTPTISRIGVPPSVKVRGTPKRGIQDTPCPAEVPGGGTPSPQDPGAGLRGEARRSDHWCQSPVLPAPARPSPARSRIPNGPAPGIDLGERPAPHRDHQRLIQQTPVGKILSRVANVRSNCGHNLPFTRLAFLGGCPTRGPTLCLSFAAS